MKRRFISYIMIIALILSFIHSTQLSSAFEFSTRILPLADTYVSSSSPDTNFGGNFHLEVLNHTSDKLITYLLFDFSNLDRNFTRILFQIQTSMFVSSTVEVGLFTIPDTDWNELDLIYNSQPTSAWNFVESQQIAKGDTWYEWTISVGRIEEGKLCIVLAAMEEKDSFDSLEFYSKDSDLIGEYKPNIHLYYKTTSLVDILIIAGSVLLFIAVVLFLIRRNNRKIDESSLNTIK